MLPLGKWNFKSAVAIHFHCLEELNPVYNGQAHHELIYSVELTITYLLSSEWFVYNLPM